jgi:hypothetical protein
MHLTIPLVEAFDNYCPGWVRSRVDQNISDNARRFQIIKTIYAEIADALKQAQVDHLVLKGFTNSPDYVPNPRRRMQSDIDLFCPAGEATFRAREALLALGYDGERGFDDLRADHLQPLRRRTAWQWRGNAYDPEMPLALELHHRFWDHSAARCGNDSVNHFWPRRVERNMEQISFSALCPIDHLGYSALNLLRDLLRWGIVTSQVYELAWFLHKNQRNQEFWNKWTEMHDQELRRLESVSFLLARTWFHCDLPEAAETEVERLPLGTQRWFESPSTTPSPMGWLRYNKDGVWLHSSLLASAADKRQVIFERLFPRRVPPLEVAVADRMLDSSPTRKSVSYRYGRHLVYLFTRVIYHLWVLPNTLWHGLCWWWHART